MTGKRFTFSGGQNSFDWTKYSKKRNSKKGEKKNKKAEKKKYITPSIRRRGSSCILVHGRKPRGGGYCYKNNVSKYVCVCVCVRASTHSVSLSCLILRNSEHVWICISHHIPFIFGADAHSTCTGQTGKGSSDHSQPSVNPVITQGRRTGFLILLLLACVCYTCIPQ